MSKFMFGVRRGALGIRERKRRQRIAKANECSFVYATIPGTGAQSWYTTRNYGEPFNGAKARHVLALVEGVTP